MSDVQIRRWNREYAEMLERNHLIHQAAKAAANRRMRKPTADDVRMTLDELDNTFADRVAYLAGENDLAAIGRVFLDQMERVLTDDEVAKIEDSGEIPNTRDDD